MKKQLERIFDISQINKKALLSFLNKEQPIDIMQLEPLIDSVMDMDPYLTKYKVVKVLQTYFTILREEALEENVSVVGMLRQFGIFYNKETKTFIVSMINSYPSPRNMYL